MVNENNFGQVKDYSAELRRIIKNIKQLRKKKQGKQTTWKSAAEWHLKYSNLKGESVLALTITLSPTGCEWAKKGGCTMCGEFEGSVKRNSLVKNPQFHIAQFSAAIGNPKIWEKVHEEGKPISWLRILQEGNYTNSKEMNNEAVEMILRLAMHIDGIKRITIESRPQYLDELCVKNLHELFKGSAVELEIGMGVEAHNEVVRNVCINKQCTNEQYVKVVKLLKKYNILPLAYVLLKPPFLTEHEAIEEAVVTAHFAANIGFSRISFEPMSIHSYTLVDALVQTNDYKLPWLWSVVEVTKKCADIANIFGIGGIGYYPIPDKYSDNHNCANKENCNNSFSIAIINYNKNRDVKEFDSLSCQCKNQWKEECDKKSLPLKERMQEQLDKVEKLIPNYTVQTSEANLTIRNQRILISGNQ
jgi:radical SAM enzyme (TIGR01210 family)